MTYHAGTRLIAKHTGEPEFVIHKVLDDFDAAQRIWIIKLINKAWERGIEYGQKSASERKYARLLEKTFKQEE